VTRLSTGIPVLDRQLDGGFPAGSIVLLSAPPASQSELFLYDFTAPRRTLYLTTLRSEESVHDSFVDTTSHVTVPKIMELGADAPLDEANQLIGMLPEESTLIIDALNPLEEQDHNRYRFFLNQLQRHLQNTDSVAILHALSGQYIPESRDMTEYMADIVFDLQTTVRGNEVINKLAVPKFRGGRALEDTVKLKLTEAVTIDTSRDIA